MNLSSVYSRTMWAMVYDTGILPSSPVEFVRMKFFLSKAEALKWFNKKFKKSHFINPRAVEVVGFEKLRLYEEPR
jgi:hypothetical protein